MAVDQPRIVAAPGAGDALAGECARRLAHLGLGAAVARGDLDAVPAQEARGRDAAACGADHECAVSRERMAEVETHCNLNVEMESSASRAPAM